MRHKGERDIPDFSAKKKEPHAVVAADKKLSKAQHPARTPAPKPPTSAKSGRRGQ